jgi:dTDP-4-dehydrorhamnose reductase
MKIVLFGHAGQLGTHLHTVLSAKATVRGFDRDQIDLADLAQLRNVLAAEKPDVIVNAAAYTAVDQAESDVAGATRINADAPRVMAEAAAASGALLIHYSTDYVFDGAATVPYTEDAATAPVSVYGRTKLAGEQAIRAAGAPHVILRTAWLYSHRGKNFLKTMLRLAEERDELRVVADQFGCPTYSDRVADATGEILARLYEHGAPRAELFGTYHIACGGITSWHGFAAKIMQLAGKSQVRVTPITTTDYPTPARRPMYSVLDCGKLARAFGIRLPAWEDALRACLDDRARTDQR